MRALNAWNTFDSNAFIMDTNWHNYLHTVISSKFVVLAGKKWDRYTHHFQTKVKQQNSLSLYMRQQFSIVASLKIFQTDGVRTLVSWNHFKIRFFGIFHFISNRFTEAKCDMRYHIKSNQKRLSYIDFSGFHSQQIQFNHLDFNTIHNRMKTFCVLSTFVRFK